MPLFKELRRTSQESFESESESNISWDVCLNSPKSGVCFFSEQKIFFWSNKFTSKKVSGVEIWNVGDRLKRVLAKFQRNRSYPRGVNGRSKFSNKSQIFDVLCRKLKCRGSTKTRFPKVWGRTEPCLTGKRPFKVSRGLRNIASLP